MRTLSIIGGGRLGRTLGALIQQSGAFRQAAVLCRSEAHAQAAVAFIGGGTPVCSMAAVPASDAYLLSVPDDVLAEVAAELALQGVPAGALVFHASGACDCSVLDPLRGHGARLASCHPAFSFAEPARAITRFAGTFCALEGDEAACTELAGLARQIGAQPFTLAAGGKAAYHAALTIASNYLVTLTGLAQTVAQQAGIDAAQSRALLGSLMHASLDNALELGAGAALTGPIVRGDLTTVQRHLQVLPQPELRASYRALGRATLRLAEPQLTSSQTQALQQLLQDPD